MMPEFFHPAVASWFTGHVGTPTPPQAAAWPALARSRNTLVAAPTGSGKTLAAFLAALDELVRDGIEGQLRDETRIVYVSPLKALSNDVERNLRAPLEGIRAELEARGLPAPEIRAVVRTGDTPVGERTAMYRRPPHILVTTPESLYLLLTSDSGRGMLASTRTVIVDEIHALAGNKRGAHLSLSLERLAALCASPPVRVGLSATQKPIEQVARFLVGSAPGVAHVSASGGQANPQAGLTFLEPAGEPMGAAGAADTGSVPAASASRPASPAAGPGSEPTVTTVPSEVDSTPTRRADRKEGGSPTANTALAAASDAEPECEIVDSGHTRRRDLALELIDAPLDTVMSNDAWGLVYDRLAECICEHRTTLVFVNTRRLAERVARHLSERLGREAVAAHHGSLAREQRLEAEQRLKAGELRVLVATASLELGIDVGDVELVCQLGSPRSIASFLQRVGRANHAVTGVPKGRLFPLSRDELVECAALLEAVRRGELDRLRIPPGPLDVLAQQIVAEVASREWEEAPLFERIRLAYPYRDLPRETFDQVVRMLADGFATRRGRRSAYLHRDAVHRRLRARRGARLTALTCGGAIPDNADYQVRLEPEGILVGTVNEDFAIESAAGDIFQLGNTSYRIRRLEPGVLRVEDAQGAPPTIPFWLGEAPGRSDELSAAVSRLRADVDRRLEQRARTFVTRSEENADLLVEERHLDGLATNELATANPSTIPDAAALAQIVAELEQELQLPHTAAEQIVAHLAAGRAMLGVVPSQERIVFERFFDEAGGMQFVIHSPYGSRINRAWGLSLRKRFCRKFNFELQAAATEDAIVLSLGETHSFPLEEVARYLSSASARDVLTQALLDAPLFTVRWRWNASISLALRRSQAGRRTPTPLQRIQAEDLLAVVFPDQIACLENIVGEREIPDHPLVKQTLDDCLEEAMDIDGFLRLLAGLESGRVQLTARDLPTPSPLAQEVLNARPYAFLDDAPLEERRTQAVMSRRWMDPAAAAEFAQLDPLAIERVCQEAWPEAASADELHDALMLLGCVTQEEGERHGWNGLLERLIETRRATRLHLDGDAGILWVAAESQPLLRAVHPQAQASPPIDSPAEFLARAWSDEEALLEWLRARLQGLGPTTADALAASLGLRPADVERTLLALESEGFALRGHFTGTPGNGKANGDSSDTEWCERRLLARIHRYTIQKLRAEIEPVEAADFMRFLFEWQGLTSEPRPSGAEALAVVLEQLEGYSAPAGAWEEDILPARLDGYDAAWVDSLCLSGRVLWTRLLPPPASNGERTRRATPVRATPIAFLLRRHMDLWRHMNPADAQQQIEGASAGARAVAAYLERHGASFFDELASGARLLPAQAEEALGELVAAGVASSDRLAGLRALLLPADRRRGMRGRRRALTPITEAGRWSLLSRPAPADGDGETGPKDAELAEHAVKLLLRRYGVIFRRLTEREGGWLPPWYELLRVLRRLEARGEVRGGRFVAGIPGEQYALPEAVASMRAVRRRPKDDTLVMISASDPLNLVGVLTPGAKVPALAQNRVLFRNGVPVAVHAGGETQFLAPFEPAEEWQARNALLRRRGQEGMRSTLH